ncbi:MAG: ROK family protein [Oligoflexia bacterium]|nr:ROK family protein [Oligoflexia bacterium]
MKYIGVDLGGTKLSIAVVNQSGKILKQKVMPSQVNRGWVSVKKLIISTINEFKKSHPDIKAVGIASAGPLDAVNGVLLDPTNFKWGRVAIVKELKNALKMPVYLENDAAAAALAETWTGCAKGKENVLMLTLGTGLGVGVICNSKLLRGGRQLHPEASHIAINPFDKTFKCGCGNYGCAESYLSGKNFEARARKKLKNNKITIYEIVRQVKTGNKKFKKLFDEYAQNFAIALNNYIVLFYPEIVVLSGGFSHVHAHFLPKAKKNLKYLLKRRLKTVNLMPQIKISKLQDSIGTIGGAYLAREKN